MKILSFQDISCVGQCSQTVALPIIAACGIETAILPSAILSTHTGGFEGFVFHDMTDNINKIICHWENLKLKFDCIYVGYLGSVRQIDFAHRIMKNLLKKAAPVIVDPVMADFGKLYAGFDMNYVEAMKKLCSSADIIMPNITEASLMTGLPYRDGIMESEYIDEILNRLAGLGAKHIILKGVIPAKNRIGIIVLDLNSGLRADYFTEKDPDNYHGTGDCFAAAFVGAYMNGKEIIESAKLATAFVLKCIDITKKDPAHWYGVKFEKAIPFLLNNL